VSAPAASPLYRKAALWGAALIAGVWLGRQAGQLLQLEGIAAKALLLFPTLLIIPFAKAMQTAEAAAGYHSQARGQFNRRALFCGLAYVALLLVAITMKQRLQPPPAAVWLIALLPVVPIGLLGLTAKRYLAEETDEFLRDSFITMALIGTGVLILVAACWGFLANFGVLPPADSTLALAIWALGAVLGDLYCRWKGR
jgi:hypothetical protein